MSTGSIIQSLPASQVDRLLAPAHTRCTTGELISRTGRHGPRQHLWQ